MDYAGNLNLLFRPLAPNVTLCARTGSIIQHVSPGLCRFLVAFAAGRQRLVFQFQLGKVGVVPAVNLTDRLIDKTRTYDDERPWIGGGGVWAYLSLTVTDDGTTCPLSQFANRR